MATPADVLRAARKRLARRNGWVQGRLAADAHGDCVYPTHSSASCWCADGAVLASIHDLPVSEMPVVNARGGTPGFYLSTAARALGFETAAMLNDSPSTKKADVLALFDLAIRMAEAPDA